MRKLTEAQAQSLLDAYFAGETVTALRNKYGISNALISMLVRGQVRPKLQRPNNTDEIIANRPREGGKITFIQAKDILSKYLAGEDTISLAQQYNTTPSNIRMLIRGHSWKSLKPPQTPHRQPFYYRNQNLPALTKHQENMITGSLLGDGWLTKDIGKKNSRFRKQQKQLEHIEWLNKELSPYNCEKPYATTSDNEIVNHKGRMPSSIKTERRIVGYCMSTIAHPTFTTLRQQWYPKNKKTIPDTLSLNSEILAIWYVDDGCTSYKNRFCNLSTQSFTFAEADRLIEILKRDLELTGRVVKTKCISGKKPIIRFSGDNYDRFLDLVTPYITWDCFDYKIKHRHKNQKRPRSITSRSSPRSID